MGRRRIVATALVTAAMSIAMLMSYMYETEGDRSVLRQLESWMLRHGELVELTAVWLMMACFGVWAVGQISVYIEMRGSYDQTKVGHILRSKKFFEGVALACVSAYWGLSLVAYYHQIHLNVWERYGVILVMVLSAFTAAFLSLRFATVLHNQREEDNVPIGGKRYNDPGMEGGDIGASTK
jgi:hypothetical protein